MCVRHYAMCWSNNTIIFSFFLSSFVLFPFFFYYLSFLPLSSLKIVFLSLALYTVFKVITSNLGNQMRYKYVLKHKKFWWVNIEVCMPCENANIHPAAIYLWISLLRSKNGRVGNSKNPSLQKKHQIKQGNAVKFNFFITLETSPKFIATKWILNQEKTTWKW